MAELLTLSGFSLTHPLEILCTVAHPVGSPPAWPAAANPKTAATITRSDDPGATLERATIDATTQAAPATAEVRSPTRTAR